MASAHAQDLPASGAEVPSFSEVYDRYFDDTWRAARRLGVSEASLDDVVQETFVMLHRKYATYDPARPVRAFLLGILGNVARAHHRTHRRKGLVLASDEQLALVPSGLPDPAKRAEIEEDVRRVRALLKELSEERRDVFLLVEVEGFSVPEVGELLDVNVNTVYTRLRAARRDFDEAHERLQRREGGSR